MRRHHCHGQGMPHGMRLAVDLVLVVIILGIMVAGVVGSIGH